MPRIQEHPESASKCCIVCGRDLDPADKRFSCPNCGSSASFDFTECIACGEPVLKIIKSCINCGSPNYYKKYSELHKFIGMFGRRDFIKYPLFLFIFFQGYYILPSLAYLSDSPIEALKAIAEFSQMAFWKKIIGSIFFGIALFVIQIISYLYDLFSLFGIDIEQNMSGNRFGIIVRFHQDLFYTYNLSALIIYASTYLAPQAQRRVRQKARAKGFPLDEQYSRYIGSTPKKSRHEKRQRLGDGRVPPEDHRTEPTIERRRGPGGSTSGRAAEAPPSAADEAPPAIRSELIKLNDREFAYKIYRDKKESAKILNIQCRVGERINKDDPIFELETEKAIIVFDSPMSGIITYSQQEGTFINEEDIILKIAQD